MAKDIALNSDTWDLGLRVGASGKKGLYLIDGDERIRQQLTITLRSFLGEWFLDTTYGVPYFEKILGKAPQQSVIASVFRTQIMSVPGVKSLQSLSLDMDRNNRVLSVAFTCDTIYGEISEQVNV